MKIQTLLIEKSPAQLRLAFLDKNDSLVDFKMTFHHKKNNVGAIIKGRVAKLAPAMEGAFIDIGTSTWALLKKAPKLTEGQAVIVQVIKAPHQGKGAIVHLNPLLQNRYVHWTPKGNKLLISPLVGKGKNAQILIKKLSTLSLKKGSLTILDKATTLDDPKPFIESLISQWAQVEAAFKQAKTGDILGKAPHFLELSLFQLPSHSKIAVNDPLLFADLKKSLRASMPDLLADLRLYKEETPLFEAMGVTEQLEQAYSRRVPLAHGGEIVIDSTEALVAIDVNMEGLSQGNGDDNKDRVNRAAIAQIAQQIKVRDLSGLILVDFISLKKRHHMRPYLPQLKASLKQQGRHIDILGLTPSGLVELTRQRTGPSLEEQLFENRRTQIPTFKPAIKASEILRQALLLKGIGKPTAYVSQTVYDALEGPLLTALLESEKRLGTPLNLIIDPLRCDVLMEKR